MPMICQVKDCKRDVVAKKMCDMHYRRLKNSGTTEKRTTLTKKCIFCGKEFVVKINSSHKKTCSKKCKQMAYENKMRNCVVADCGSKAKSAHGYCSKHYTRIKVHGDPYHQEKISKYASDAICIVESCSKKPVARNMCQRHWILWKKHGDPNGGAYVQKIRKAITHEDGTRTCSECEIRQPISNFHKDKNATDGFRSKCKTCRIGMVKSWYRDNADRQRSRARDFRKENIDELRERDRNRYEKDKPKRLELASKHSQIRRSRKMMLPYDKRISRNGIRKIFGENCYYCKIQMDFSPATKRKFKKNHATIEHLIPLSKGGHHVWENVVLACHSCNTMKNAKSEDEFEIYLINLAKKRKSK